MSTTRYYISRPGATCRPGSMIAPPRGRSETFYRDAETADIISTILHADTDSERCIIDVSCLRGASARETMRNVWAFVRENIRYRPDRAGHERVKSPCALFSEGVGDCKSFSIAEGAMLRALGIPYRYRFTSYAPGDFTHVYIVATDPATGDDVILDAVHTSFDEEVEYYRKKDIRPGGSTGVHGIGAVSASLSSTSFWLGGAALLFILLSQRA